MMKLTDATTAEKMAAELLEPGADPAKVDNLAERLELARTRGEIPTIRKYVQGRQRFNTFDGQYHQTRKPVDMIRLADAAEWAHRQGFAIRPDILERMPNLNPGQTAEADTGQARGKWPWGSDYETPLLRILADAVDHFCVKNDPAYYPKKPDTGGEVIDWIMARMKAEGMPASNALAGAMETLIAPRPYVHHRQRKRGKP